jgi:mannan endo-1,4-beta-mannosidase
MTSENGKKVGPTFWFRSASHFVLPLISVLSASASDNSSLNFSGNSSVLDSLGHSFVTVANKNEFVRDGARYAYLGTNFWYGMNLGSTGPGGDRERLIRELDRLQALGITNLRILAGSEGPDSEPWRIVPSLQKDPGVYDEDLLIGLDFLISEMGKRGQTAVVILNNFWNWSGGMSQYLRWAGADPIPYPPPAKGGSWITFQNYTTKFYSNDTAMGMFRNFVQMIVTRTNSVTGIPYANDPTIMSWELANEPRGFGNTDKFNKWIDQTSKLIKSLDSNHLVTTGCEGTVFGAGLDFVRNHSYKGIDYATAHVWVQNWGYFDPADAANTYPGAVSFMKDYVQTQINDATKLKKPVVLEEFGLARDLDSYSPADPTTYRDQYYGEVFSDVYQHMTANAPIAGVNFWAWGGEAAPSLPLGAWWKPGDAFLGDPPHEHQGWYSIFAGDTSTLGVIDSYAAKMSTLK